MLANYRMRHGRPPRNDAMGALLQKMQSQMDQLPPPQQQYEQEQAPQHQEQHQQHQHQQQVPSSPPQYRWVKWVTWILMLSALGVGAYFVYRYMKDRGASASEGGTSSEESSSEASGDASSSAEGGDEESSSGSENNSSSGSAAFSWRTALEIGIPAFVIIGCLILAVYIMKRRKDSAQRQAADTKAILAKMGKNGKSMEETIAQMRQTIDSLSQRRREALGESDADLIAAGMNNSAARAAVAASRTARKGAERLDPLHHDGQVAGVTRQMGDLSLDDDN